jgi:hypothetical protein
MYNTPTTTTRRQPQTYLDTAAPLAPRKLPVPANAGSAFSMQNTLPLPPKSPWVFCQEAYSCTDCPCSCSCLSHSTVGMGSACGKRAPLPAPQLTLGISKRRTAAPLAPQASAAYPTPGAASRGSTQSPSGAQLGCVNGHTFTYTAVEQPI